MAVDEVAAAHECAVVLAARHKVALTEAAPFTDALTVWYPVSYCMGDWVIHAEGMGNTVALLSSPVVGFKKAMRASVTPAGHSSIGTS